MKRFGERSVQTTGSSFLLVELTIYQTLSLDNNKNPPAIAGGISVSGIALILLAAHKCAFYWPASHAIITLTRLSGTEPKPSSERKGDRVSGGRSLRYLKFIIALF